MFSFSRVAAAFAVALALSSGVYSIGQITRSGRYLYSSDGSRFYIKGVAYQEQGKYYFFQDFLYVNVMPLPGVANVDPNAPFSEPSTFVDPLANGTACQRDLPYLKQLGVNTVRVYSVNASLNHDTCMQALSGAGIYVMYVTVASHKPSHSMRISRS
jgi:1,3-beta-glucanosyltransferase GAS1